MNPAAITMDYAALAWSTATEIALAGLALLVVLLDVTALRGRDPGVRARVLGAISALGLVAIGGLALQQLMSVAPGFVHSEPARMVVVDRLALLLTLAVLATTLATVLISIHYEFTRHVGEYFAVTLFAALGMTLLVKTQNLLMFFVALELLSICLYILTAFHKGLLRSSEAAVKYFMFGALSSAFLLFGLTYVAGCGGSLDLVVLAKNLRALGAAGAVGSPLLVIGMLFVIVGLGFKIAVVPFHLWAPDAYEGAPTPVAAFIATGSKIASFVVAAKILIIGFVSIEGSAAWPWNDVLTGSYASWRAGFAPILAIIATASMVWGNLAAIRQRNTKRMLAYSSVAHAGYMLIAIIATNEAGVVALVFNLIAYSLTNLGAFGVIAALTRAAGGDDLEDLDGMAQRAPLMSLLLLVFVLSLAGIPPLAGFFGKFLLFGAAVQADSTHYGLMWLVVVGLATSAVSLYYYLVLLKHVFIHAPRRAVAVVTPRVWKYTLVVLGIGVLVVGAWPQPLLGVVSDFVREAAIAR